MTQTIIKPISTPGNSGVLRGPYFALRQSCQRTDRKAIFDACMFLLADACPGQFEYARSANIFKIESKNLGARLGVSNHLVSSNSNEVSV